MPQFLIHCDENGSIAEASCEKNVAQMKDETEEILKSCKV